MRRRSRIPIPILTRHLAAIALIASTSACSSVNPKPFRDYHEAFTEIQASAEQILEVDQEWVHESYFAEITTADTALADVQLLFDENSAYDWTLRNEPLFVVIKRTQIAFSRLNNAFAGYTDLLAQLAGGKMASQEIFDSLATQLNTNSRSAAASLGLDDTSDEAALFSTLAMNAAKAFIDKKRKSKLKQLIADNQSHVQYFTDGASIVVQITAEDLKNEYTKRFGNLADEWSDTPATGRPDLIKRALALNDQMTGYLRTLESLDQGYSTLSRKHAELAMSLDKDSYYTVKELTNIAKRLEGQYKELKEAKDEPDSTE